MKVTEGGAKHGSSPSDNGAQAGSGPDKMSDESLKKGMSANTDKWVGSEKEQGYVNVKGTM